jgi:hypothetical protein
MASKRSEKLIFPSPLKSNKFFILSIKLSGFSSSKVSSVGVSGVASSTVAVLSTSLAVGFSFYSSPLLFSAGFGNKSLILINSDLISATVLFFTLSATASAHFSFQSLSIFVSISCLVIALSGLTDNYL